MALQSNQIRNCPVTEKDVDLVEKIFGPDMAALKGKSVRTQLEQRKDETIAVPKELIRMNLNIHMHINVIQVNRVNILTMIGYPLCYWKTVYLENNKAEALYLSLDKILRYCNGRGYQVSNVTCDNSFRTMFEDASNNLDVMMECTNLQDHKSHIERNN